MKIEWRVGWSASTNNTFRGETDWQEWDDGDATLQGVYDALHTSTGTSPLGLDLVFESSGFEWWVEAREVQP